MEGGDSSRHALENYATPSTCYAIVKACFQVHCWIYVLQHLAKLQQLKLQDNTIEYLHQVAIAKSNSKSVKRVYLINNHLQLAGAQTLTRILT